MKVKSVQILVDDALAHVEKLLDAAAGDASECSALEGGIHGTPLSDSQREHVRSYVESWIEPQLRAALVLLDEPPRTPYTLTEFVDVTARGARPSRFAGELRAASQDGPDELRDFVAERVC